MTDFNPQINQQVPQPITNTGYGRIFCNYPRRRADVAINNGMESYQFSLIKHTHTPQSLDPRAQVRNDGVMDSYSQGSPIAQLPGYVAPYAKENEVQDRVTLLNRDTKAQRLTSGPSASKTMPVHTTLGSSRDMPRISIPNPKIPVYNHLIPFEAVEQFAKCPCTEPKFQSVEHIWANGTRVKGYDPRLYKQHSHQYQSAIKNSREYPFYNTHMCPKTKNE